MSEEHTSSKVSVRCDVVSKGDPPTFNGKTREQLVDLRYKGKLFITNIYRA